MHSTDIHAHARRLVEAYGTKAMAVAAHKARSAQDADDAPKAETWRRVEAAIAAMRGAAQS